LIELLDIILGDKMKELWVKKTIYRRYLVEDEDVSAVNDILLHDDNGCDLVGDIYDKNDDVEYDNEEAVKPIHFEIKAI
jgi:hypothetical protein